MKRSRGLFQATAGPSRNRRIQGLKGRVFSLPKRMVADGSIEAGLICLRAWQSLNPGRVLTRDEIAYVCGCTDSLIYSIEARAIAKLRRRHEGLLNSLLQ